MPHEFDSSGIFIKMVEIVEKTAGSIQNTVFKYEVDERWRFEFNGHPKEVDGVPAFSVAVFYNGWPAGILDPYGGTFAAGSAANETTYSEALDAALARLS